MSLSIPQIVATVQADLTSQGFTVEVLFGDWKVAQHNGANRVVFGLAGFEYEPPGPANAPGVQLTGPTKGARSLMTRVQYCNVWVHAAPDPDPKKPNRSELAQQATADLLHGVLAALYRCCHGSFGWGKGEWLKPERQEFLYGSVCKFVAQFSIPVLDKPLTAVKPDAEGSTGALYASFPEKDELVAQSP